MSKVPPAGPLSILRLEQVGGGLADILLLVLLPPSILPGRTYTLFQIAVPLLYAFVGAALVALGRRQRRINPFGGFLFALLVGLVVWQYRQSAGSVAVSQRDALFGGFAVVAFALFAFGVLATTGRTPAERLLRMLSTWASVNLVLWVAGAPIMLGAASAQRNAFLGVLGFQTIRVAFPLGGGANTGGLVFGALLAAAICRLSPRRDATLKQLALVGLGMVGVVLADSRLALLYALVTPLTLAVIQKLRSVAAVPLVTATLLVPLAWTTIGPYFGAHLGPLSRSGSSVEESTLNGRLYMWQAWTHYVGSARFRPFGWGNFGYISSDLVWAYIPWLTGGGVPSLGFLRSYPVHNSLMQWVVDGGFLGALVMAVAVWWTISVEAARSKRSRTERGALGLGIYLTLTMATEYTLTPYQAVTFMLFLWLLAGAMFTDRPQTLAAVTQSRIVLSGPKARV